MTDSSLNRTRSYARAAAKGRQARNLLIDLTHDLPEEAAKDLLRLWNEADTALLTFLRRLDDQPGRFDKDDE